MISFEQSITIAQLASKPYLLEPVETRNSISAKV